MNSFCIIGLGKFGTTLAVTLASEKKNQVLVIDSDKTVVSSIANSVNAAVVGDPLNIDVLRGAAVADYDCAIVTWASNFDDSTLLTLMLKDLGVKKVIARASSDNHKRVLEKIGADMVVFPERDMGERLANIISRKNAIEYIEFSGDCLIAEIAAPKKWIGKNLIQLDLRSKSEVSVIAVTDPKTGEVSVTPNPKLPIKEGAMLTLIGKKYAVDKLTNLI